MTDIEKMLIQANNVASDKYPELVVKYIREKYTLNDELAIRNNYDLDNQKYAEEYETYQRYRLACKQRAKEELGIE